ncbi:hypothetical protein LSH36_1259g00008 [Paralvinella palmiformis]|uniref:Uncharacterized protein n=1 Tax=Paralvinella palmiformis TaxID=53620 RepID=A0AAD9IUD8_9ANNE|nr:hypothetical protein LSH36_1259g00008 [Paralvinella palmiformis]
MPSKVEPQGSEVIEEIITDAAMTLEGMQRIVLDASSGAILQQRMGQSEDGTDAATNESVQIPVDENTTLLIEHFTGDAMIVPQMVTAETGSSAGHCGEGERVEHDQMVTTLMGEPQVTEVYMIIPTSDGSK